MDRSVNLLKVTSPDGARRWYADGRRITRDRHDRIRDGAVDVDSMSTQIAKGSVYQRSVARVAGPRPGGPTHRILIRNEALGEDIHAEELSGTDLEAERRLGVLWNDRCAHLPDRGFVATVSRIGEIDPFQTIEG